MRPSAILQHIQHIASLGLADAVAVPEMLTALQLAVPASFASFYWIDRTGTIERVFAAPEVRAEMARFEVDLPTLDPRYEPTMHRILEMGRMMDNTVALMRTFDSSRSVMVNELMPAMRLAVGVDLVMRRDGQPRAVLYLNREWDAPSFSPVERRLLAAASPYLTHALGPGRGDAGQSIDSRVEREAVLTVDREGAIVSGAGDVDVLAELTGHSRARHRGTGLPDRLPLGLMPLLDRLRESANGRIVPPARLTLTGLHGEYRARAYPSETAGEAGFASAVVIVSHHLPREVMLLRRVLALPLTPAERRAAFLVGEGVATGAIATQLGISAQTLRGYLKSIYARTGANGRDALAALLRDS